MNFISKLLRILPLLFVVITFTACSDDDDNGTPPITDPDIVDIAISNPELTTLVTALQLADDDLDDLLTQDGPFTVLAPDNTAFANFLTANGFADLRAVPTDVLAEVLKNHVIAGEIVSTDLISAGSGYDNTSANGPDGNALSIYFDTSTGSVVFNGISTVDTPDIDASNGVIHIVDEVISRPTIATFATSNSNLSSLVAALQLADTGTPSVPNGYIATVSDATAGPFTVLAPTDDAFENLLLELDPSGNTELGDVDVATADAILTYHITAAGNVQSTGLAGLNGTFPSLGGDIDIDATALTVTDLNGRVSNILANAGLVDIQAMNGVVHAIDQVLLPPSDD